MTSIVRKVRTAWRLGLRNLARVAFYRLSVKLGVNPVRRLEAAVPVGQFFRFPDRIGVIDGLHAPRQWASSGRLFSHRSIQLDVVPPIWHRNPLTNRLMPEPSKPWWLIADFNPEVGDIKLIWELSRFDWVLAFAQRAVLGDKKSLQRLNSWLRDWCVNNPPYLGPNWKCGQEASIRVMHLAMAALILEQTDSPESGMADLLSMHLKRISPTLQYAMAQDNNHGTSEAAALFIGGSWLVSLGHEAGSHWERTGRRWLEERANRLIGSNGTFSQYSLNYHRVMLDTFCMVEIWRQRMVLPPFSGRWSARLLAATQWLRHMVNQVSGDGPNVGANDGARLLQLSNSEYRDHRPTIQLAMALFAEQRAFADDGTWNDQLRWLNVPLPKVVSPLPGNLIADDGGFAMLRRGNVMAMLRYPRFKFRPSQADALHLDLWHAEENWLRDAGTYSYNTEDRWLNYFGGTLGHNTVQFDDRDQMPRISRFLLGNWLRTNWSEALSEREDGVSFGAGYRDSFGVSHRRRIALSDKALKVIDEVKGFSSKAVLRWRVAPGNWILKKVGSKLHLVSKDNNYSILVSTDVTIVRCELHDGWESRYYMEKTTVPVLEVEIYQHGTFTTEVRWEL